MQHLYMHTFSGSNEYFEFVFHAQCYELTKDGQTQTIHLLSENECMFAPLNRQFTQIGNQNKLATKIQDIVACTVSILHLTTL